ncbi:MAG: ribonuclease Z [Clostridia bacterium]|nr:ribonuclease Z [Clostridia bacterium]
MIDITLLGTSALVPLPDRALTAVALTCGGRSILFDCGEGTQTAARKAGASMMKADLIALTHYHGDHIFGLPGLLQTMCCLGRTDPLYITGPEGLKEELSPILKLAGWMSYEIVLIPFPEEGLRLETLAKGWPTEAKLTAFKTEHRVPSQGYCFTLGRAGKFLPQKAKELGVPVNQWSLLQKGQSVQAGEAVIRPEQVLGEPRKGLKFVFSGDTSPCAGLIAAAKEADLLISEATYGENEQAELAIDHGHMNFAQAASIARQAQVKQLWLAHYSQMVEDPEAYLPNAASIFANTLCGQDGMRAALRFENETESNFEK